MASKSRSGAKVEKSQEFDDTDESDAEPTGSDNEDAEDVPSEDASDDVRSTSESEGRGKNNSMVAKTCWNKEGIPPLDLGSVPRTEILSLRTKTPIDILRDRFPLPQAGRPPFGMKRWLSFPVGSNLSPLHPGDALHSLSFSRGFLASSLVSKNATPFNTQDDRVLRSPYSALHDPGCSNYLMAPEVCKLLIDKGLITATGQVLCSYKEMQQFHEYLLEIRNACVNEVLDEESRRTQFENEQKRQLTRKNAVQKELQIKRHKAELRERPQSVPNYRSSEEAEYRLLAIKKQKELEQIRRMEKSLERDMKAQLVIAKNRIKERDHRRQLLLDQTLKEVAAFLRRQNEIVDHQEVKARKKLEWVAAKIDCSQTKAERNEALEMAIMADRRKRAEKRQRQVEKAQSEFPKWAKRHKDSQTRLWRLVKKYFYIWLTKTRERKAQREKDGPEHQSTFAGRAGKKDPMVQVVMDLQYLKQKGFTHFIGSIMNLRKGASSMNTIMTESMTSLMTLNDQNFVPSESASKNPNTTTMSM